MTPESVPFPEEQAAKIIEYAEKTGQYLIVRIVNEVRHWLGHPEAVLAIAARWSPTAKKELVKADDTIVNARTAIAGNWTGTASEAYLAYLDHVAKVMADTADLFERFSKKLLDMLNHVTEAYKIAIALMGNTAAEIISVTGGVWGTIGESIFGVADKVLQALANFVRQLTSTTERVAQVMADFKRTGLEIAQVAADLTIPEPLPAAAADSSDWKVRPK
ncbi:hypothetical protein [Saccharopolyspora phatthalungensis]|uniref:Uncharacterized protein YukE n=1 Tax=Saccharopolyspora phatthalungensis TaxID=664693 RepID=A0A840QGW1_9PSEU|nr:hypothetical protein [Saccharopolyspora phatthalungensis]MBB5156433.1 uncharacterized protein YukE [Saccharopolyspora phatthalungensis]